MTLREELEFVDSYVQIERIRFEERLEVAFLAGSDALDGLVPAFSLQPLVENAVRHGIGPRQRGGSIEIESREGFGTTARIRLSGAGFGAGAGPPQRP